jgi:hypothetical protein
MSRNHRFHFEETLMTTFRMFAFFGALLVTALLFRALAYGFSPPQNDAAGISHDAAGISHLALGATVAGSPASAG